MFWPYIHILCRNEAIGQVAFMLLVVDSEKFKSVFSLNFLNQLLICQGTVSMEKAEAAINVKPTGRRSGE